MRLKFFGIKHCDEQVHEEQDCDDPGDNELHTVLYSLSQNRT
jgi:hypothetical protein